MITTDEELRKQAWDYFQLQASQRLTAFNFYIAVSSLLATGLAASFKSDVVLPQLGIAVGLLLMLFSVVFWKLDHRNSCLINSAEETLKFFERKSALNDAGQVPHVAKRFLREAYDLKHMKRHTFLFFLNQYGYSVCFNAVFLIFGTVGLAGLVYFATQV